MKSLIKTIKSKLRVDTVSRRGEIYTVRQSYFYHHGRNEQNIIDDIMENFPNAKIIDSGDHWAPFRGGDSVAKGSHLYVKFMISEN